MMFARYSYNLYRSRNFPIYQVWFIFPVYTYIHICINRYWWKTLHGDIKTLLLHQQMIRSINRAGIYRVSSFEIIIFLLILRITVLFWGIIIILLLILKIMLLLFSVYCGAFLIFSPLFQLSLSKMLICFKQYWKKTMYRKEHLRIYNTQIERQSSTKRYVRLLWMIIYHYLNSKIQFRKYLHL